MADLRNDLERIPGLQYKFDRPTLFTFKTPVEIEIVGYDLAKLRSVSDQVKQKGTVSADAAQEPIPANIIASTSDEPVVRPGQIRLLGPTLPLARTRLIYFAILCAGEPGTFLVAPHSRFSQPATEGELLTRRQSPCLSVLALWNARELSPALLRESWVVDDLSPAELDSALAIFNWINGRVDIPSQLERRVGPRLYHPSDPRRIYLREESAVMDAVSGRTLYVTRNGGGPRELPKAAEPGATYGTDSSESNGLSPDSTGEDPPDTPESGNDIS